MQATHTVTARTKWALFAMHLLNEPFMVLFTMLHFVLRKDLGATAFQLALFTSLRPILAVFSFYWGANLLKQRHRLVSNLMGAFFLARICFLLLPFYSNIWFMIFAAGMYELFNRAGTPALIEILKVNMEKKTREHVFSTCFVLSFAESILLGLAFGNLMTNNFMMWSSMMFGATLFSLAALMYQLRIPLPFTEVPIPQKTSLHERFIAPWQRMFTLLKKRPDFTRFQFGFMLGGFGLMLIAPAKSIYFADVLHLTHGDIVLARSVFMGIGVIGSTALWRRGLETRSIPFVTMCMLFGFSCFPALLLLGSWSKAFTFFAFLTYGIAQAGSHLLWNLSGTFFAGNDDSSQYTSVNVLTVGLRGLVGPMSGAALCSIFGPHTVLGLGMVFCLLGIVYTMVSEKESRTEKDSNLQPPGPKPGTLSN